MSQETYKLRWSKVEGAITQAINDMKSAANEEKKSSNLGWRNTATLIEILKRLKTFAGEAVEWLGSPINVPKDMKIVNRYPQQYACNLIVRQAAHDLRAIWHIFMQRCRGYVQPNAIERSERVAYAALEPAFEAEFFDREQPPRLFTYFQKSPSIRVMPYANAGLIALPYWLKDVSSNDDDRNLLNDFLAVPHEVGHFVYWRGFAKDKIAKRDEFNKEIVGEVRTTIARLVKRKVMGYSDNNIMPTESILKRWSEEIFADIYGFMTAGPASVASMLDMLLDQNWREDMYELHDEHPAPMLRPEAILAVIQLREDESNKKIDEQLRAYWKKKPLLGSLHESKEAISAVYDHLLESYSLRGEVARFAEWIYKRFSSKSTDGSATQQLPSVQLNQTCNRIRSGMGPQATSSNLQTSTSSASPDERLRLLQEWQENVELIAGSPPPSQKPLDLNLGLGQPLKWEEWLGMLCDEYETLAVTSMHRNNTPDEATARKNLMWIVAMSAGGWTDGPANGGNKPV